MYMEITLSALVRLIMEEYQRKPLVERHRTYANWDMRGEVDRIEIGDYATLGDQQYAEDFRNGGNDGWYYERLMADLAIKGKLAPGYYIVYASALPDRRGWWKRLCDMCNRREVVQRDIRAYNSISYIQH